MNEFTQSPDSGQLKESAGQSGLSPLSVSALAAFLDTSVIVLAALVSGAIYYTLVLDSAPPVVRHLGWGCTMAAAFIAVAALRGDYGFDAYLSSARSAANRWLNWSISIAIVVIEMFLLKASVDVSRGATILLYVIGFAGLLGARSVGRLVFRRLDAAGWIAPRRILVIGSDRAAMNQAAGSLKRNARSTFRQAAFDELSEPLTELVGNARQFNPDEIILVFRLDEALRIDRVAEALAVIPARMVLIPQASRFIGVRKGLTPEQKGILLMRPPLTPAERLLKRVMDLAGASILVVVLSPLLALTAIAIRLESAGPALFRQTRYGFNQKPFRIFKFRTMTVMEDGQAFKQARANDKRITRLGKFLRQKNIDELPQLFNVLSGEMSLVGPRPHPIALDDSFDSRIAHFARRHAIKPGISGWAQVHGFRGETDTVEKMRSRVEFDLDYIENWSIGLDFQILLMTVFSRSAYRNAG